MNLTTCARTLAVGAAILLMVGCVARGRHGTTSAGYGGSSAYSGNTYSSNGGSGRSNTSQSTSNAELDAAMHDLAQKLAAPLPETDGPSRKVAVVDFVNLQGTENPLGRYIAEDLMIELWGTSRVVVVERGLLENALAELEFNATDLVDQGKAQQLGRMVGADLVATGTLTDRQSDMKINARLIETETTHVVSAAAVAVPMNAFLARGGSATPARPGQPADPPWNGGHSHNPGPGSNHVAHQPPANDDDPWTPGGQEPPVGSGPYGSVESTWQQLLIAHRTGNVAAANNCVTAGSRWMLNNLQVLAALDLTLMNNPTPLRVHYDGYMAEAVVRMADAMGNVWEDELIFRFEAGCWLLDLAG